MKHSHKIYVQIQGEGNDEFLNATKNIGDLDDGVIAIYRLFSLVDRKTEYKLETLKFSKKQKEKLLE